MQKGVPNQKMANANQKSQTHDHYPTPLCLRAKFQDFLLTHPPIYARDGSTKGPRPAPVFARS